MQTISFKKISNFLLDIVFPHKCVFCGKLDEIFCDDCRDDLQFIKTQTCPFCGRISPRGLVCCKSCRSKSSLTGVTVMAHYEEPLISAIKAYKYEFIKVLAEPLSELAWPLFSDFGPKVVVTCVPSNRKRMSWRGYNQAEELARCLAKDSSLPFIPGLLRRISYEIPQTQLSKKARLKNVEKAFAVNKKVDLNGKTVVIVDDLITSGATLDACAKQIRKLGARQVWGFTLAKHI